MSEWHNDEDKDPLDLDSKRQNNHSKLLSVHTFINAEEQTLVSLKSAFLNLSLPTRQIRLNVLVRDGEDKF